MREMHNVTKGIGHIPIDNIATSKLRIRKCHYCNRIIVYRSYRYTASAQSICSYCGMFPLIHHTVNIFFDYCRDEINNGPIPLRRYKSRPEMSNDIPHWHYDLMRHALRDLRCKMLLVKEFLTPSGFHSVDSVNYRNSPLITIIACQKCGLHCIEYVDNSTRYMCKILGLCSWCIPIEAYNMSLHVVPFITKSRNLKHVNTPTSDTPINGTLLSLCMSKYTRLEQNYITEKYLNPY
jgi:hypothetical protein